MRIALITDSHVAPAPPASSFVANYRAAARAIADHHADLTVHLGDITVDGAADVRQLEFARALSAEWPTPIRFLPGNHDIGDNPPAPGMATKEPLDVARIADFRRILNHDYWSHEAEGWTLIGLNAQLFGTGTDEESEQEDWLAVTLGSSRGDIILIKI